MPADDRTRPLLRSGEAGVPLAPFDQPSACARGAAVPRVHSRAHLDEELTGSRRALSRGGFSSERVRSGGGHVASSVSLNSSEPRFLIRDANAGHDALGSLRIPGTCTGPSAKSDRRPTASELRDAFGAAAALRLTLRAIVLVGVLAAAFWGDVALQVLAGAIGGRP